MKRMVPFLRGSGFFLVLAPLLMLLEVFCDLWQPTLMANIIDIGVANGDWPYVLQVGGQMLGVAILGLVGGFGCLYFSAVSTAACGARLRQALFDHIQSFSFAQLDHFKTSSLITRLTNDVTQLQNMLLSAQRILIRAPFLCIGGLVMAYTLSPALSMVFLVAIPILSAAIVLILRKSIPIFGIVQSKVDQMNIVSRETLLGVRVIKAFVTQDREIEKFERSNEALLEWNIKAQMMMVLLMPFVTFVVNVTIVTVLWMGGHMVMLGTLEIGKIMAFITYILQIMMSLTMSMMIMMNFARAKASADRVNEVFDTHSSILPPTLAETATNHNVAFHHVYFKYTPNSQWVLKNISFSAEAGETIGIIGSTGSGKSSLVSLIPRLYDVTEGSVTIGGIDVKHWDQTLLHQAVTMVSQENILFSGTIDYNLRFGNPEATKEELMEAIQMAQAQDIIAGKAEGLESVIEQRGQNLSGGQKQRLAIARALLKKPKILILDDAGSALDLVTETKIEQALAHELMDCTTFIVASRISAISHASQIIVLDQGEMVGLGTHEELLKDCAIYRTIAQIQFGEEVLERG